MSDAKDYAGYHRTEPRVSSAQDVMVRIYARFPVLGQPFRHVARCVPEDARILDVGCGRGQYLRIVRRLRPRAELLACDLSDDLDRAELESVRFSACDVEAQALPYPDASFHHVNCMHVLEHLHSPLPLMREILRVLRPGGTAYVETPDVRLTMVPHVPLLTGCEGGINFWDDPTHRRPYSRPALFRLSRMAGFQQVESCLYVRRWAHLLALPLALVSRNNDFKMAVLHALGFFCAVILRR